MRVTSAIAIAIACILLLLESSASAASFTWESHYGAGAVIGDGDVRSQDGVLTTLNKSVVSDSDGGTFDLSTVAGTADFHTVFHSELGGHTGFALLAFDNQNDDPADYLTITLSFGVSLLGLQFSLLDIDGASGNAWDDGVEVTYNGGLNVRSTPSLFSLPSVAQPSVALDNEPGYQGFEGWNGRSAASDETIGNVDFDFGAVPISEITIRYFSTDDAASNPAGQIMGISDLAWTSTIITPEPGTGVLLGLGLLGLTLAGSPPRTRPIKRRGSAAAAFLERLLRLP